MSTEELAAMLGVPSQVFCGVDRAGGSDFSAYIAYEDGKLAERRKWLEDGIIKPILEQLRWQFMFLLPNGKKLYKKLPEYRIEWR